MANSRRAFLAGLSATAGGLCGLPARSAAASPSRSRNLPGPARMAGTTLEQTAAAGSQGPYRRIVEGPGWPLVVRADLAAPESAREARRTALASFVQFTDLHIVDTESPMRVEWLAKSIGSAHRPHEMLSVQAASALVDRVNSLQSGPWTGMPFSSVINTGDVTDNHEQIELEWYLKVMSGGRIVPSSGDPTRYEGVQDSGNTEYWHPAATFQDAYKKRGFPYIPDYLAAASRPFTATGLRTPWYSVVGNHDESMQGNIADSPILDALYTSEFKTQGAGDYESRMLAKALRTDPASAVAQMSRQIQAKGLVRRITPDERRRPFTAKDFAAAHLRADYLGAGPVGHGFTSDAVGSGRLYYTFQIADGVLGVCLDTTNPAGLADGSIGTAQLRWLEGVLQAHSSRWYDTGDRLMYQSNSSGGTRVIIFSHHTSTSMGNLLPDPKNLFEARHDGKKVVALLQRYPNVVAWINGHSHRNQILAHNHSIAERRFWEINTASHIDYPQHARVLELADNHDGTLSLFTTLVEARARYTTDVTDTSIEGLNAFYRELALNDPYAGDGTVRLGTLADRNTELIIPVPGAGV
ncbi:MULTISPECIES: TIGR03767 family metallophosphoesterase [Streptomyces]|uniref:TIGR03767 family metallophosphoesterase n=1 Tax=Streptomyces TaxID=1883 RepID=UPI00099E0DD5|nr:TIGR03767 family metallophosphoesterase [Streptomyces virginiae]